MIIEEKLFLPLQNDYLAAFLVVHVETQGILASRLDIYSTILDPFCPNFIFLFHLLGALKIIVHMLRTTCHFNLPL